MENRISTKIKIMAALVPVVFVLCLVSANGFNRSFAKTSKVDSRFLKSDGASVYSKYCARCHGADGKANTAKGKQTRATDLTKSRIATAAGLKVIAKGKELMPGFKDTVSEAEMQSVMTYVKGFRN